MTVTVKTEAVLNWKAENCFEFLVKNHPTCKLYSQDGFFVKCHKEVLIQTPFLRKLLKDSSNCSHFSEQVDIFFPFVNHQILEQINIFLYTGEIDARKNEEIDQICEILVKVLGFPLDLPSKTSHLAKVQDKIDCPVGECEEIVEVTELLDHYAKDILEEIEVNTELIELRKTIKCRFCRSFINYIQGNSDQNDRQNVLNHYLEHEENIKNYLKETCNFEEKRNLADILNPKRAVALNDSITILQNMDCNDEDAISCDLCKDNFASNIELKKHVIETHGVGKRKNFMCNSCKKCFVDETTMKLHIATSHLNSNSHRFSCLYCDKVFDKQENLQTHYKSEHKEKIFKCEYCSQTFKNSTQLHFHKEENHNPRKYKCKPCDKTFESYQKFHIHQRKMHGILCEICKKTFTTQKNLMKHRLNSHKLKVEPFE